MMARTHDTVPIVAKTHVYIILMADHIKTVMNNGNVHHAVHIMNIM